MAEPTQETADRILVVEGYSDLHVYRAVLAWLSNVDGVWIKQMGGKGNLTGGARTEDLVLKLETFLSPGPLAKKKAIGVIADADADAVKTAQSLGGRLSRITGQTVTAQAWTAGSPRIGLFVVPANDRPGEIESLVWEAWSNDPTNAAVRACIDGFLACMKAAGHEAHSPDKGRLGALLAVRHEDDPRLGPAARARVFDFTRPELAPLVDFLRAF